MHYLHLVIQIFFSTAMFINAALFIPQAVKIFREKACRNVSFWTFLGFLLIQTSMLLHGIVRQDILLIIGCLASMLTCGSVVLLILVYREKSSLPAA